MLRKIPNQIYVPPAGFPGEPTTDPITTQLPKIGQLNPAIEERHKQMHGRYLAGLGASPSYPDAPYPTKYRGQSVIEDEQTDDVYGSGIFDEPGRKAIQNRTMGVFEAAYSVPGYIGRERLFQISNEVKDATNGAAIVVVPSGGMTFMERNGVPIDFGARDMPSPCSPEVFSNTACRQCPGPPQPPLFVNPMGPPPPRVSSSAPMHARPAPAPKPAWPSGRPVSANVARPALPARGLVSGKPVMNAPSARPGPYTNTASFALSKPSGGPSASFALSKPSTDTTGGTSPMRPVYTDVPPSHRLSPLRKVGTSQVGGTKNVRMASFGAEDSPPGLGTYAVVGLAIGATIAMFVGATKIKVKQ